MYYYSLGSKTNDSLLDRVVRRQTPSLQSCIIHILAHHLYRRQCLILAHRGLKLRSAQLVMVDHMFLVHRGKARDLSEKHHRALR